METELKRGCKQYTEVPQISKKMGVGTKLISEAAELMNKHPQTLSSESVTKNVIHSVKE